MSQRKNLDMNTNSRNRKKDKEDCERRGGEFNPITGECIIPQRRVDDLTNVSITSIEDQQKSDNKQECENKGGEWKDPPGECKFPTI